VIALVPYFLLLAPQFRHSDSSSLPSVGLCFSRSLVRSGTRRVACGAPMASRAADFTAVTARNGFGFFLFAMKNATADLPRSRGSDRVRPALRVWTNYAIIDSEQLRFSHY